MQCCKLLSAQKSEISSPLQKCHKSHKTVSLEKKKEMMVMKSWGLVKWFGYLISSGLFPHYPTFQWNN